MATAPRAGGGAALFGPARTGTAETPAGSGAGARPPGGTGRPDSGEPAAPDPSAPLRAARRPPTPRAAHPADPRAARAAGAARRVSPDRRPPAARRARPHPAARPVGPRRRRRRDPAPAAPGGATGQPAPGACGRRHCAAEQARRLRPATSSSTSSRRAARRRPRGVHRELRGRRSAARHHDAARLCEPAPRRRCRPAGRTERPRGDGIHPAELTMADADQLRTPCRRRARASWRPASARRRSAWRSATIAVPAGAGDLSATVRVPVTRTMVTASSPDALVAAVFPGGQLLQPGNLRLSGAWRDQHFELITPGWPGAFADTHRRCAMSGQTPPTGPPSTGGAAPARRHGGRRPRLRHRRRPRPRRRTRAAPAPSGGGAPRPPAPAPAPAPRRNRAPTPPAPRADAGRRHRPHPAGRPPPAARQPPAGRPPRAEPPRRRRRHRARAPSSRSR